MYKMYMKDGLIASCGIIIIVGIICRDMFPPPFWIISRFIFLAVVGVIIGYCAYRGTICIENAVPPSDLLLIFNDGISHNHGICPATGEICIRTKCAPAILQTYGEAKSRYLLSYCDTPSIWTFGGQWFLFSASAVTLLYIWGTQTNRDYLLLGFIFAAIPIITFFLFTRFGIEKCSCPKKFSDRFPPIDDVIGFNDTMERYCIYLNRCASIMEKASENYTCFRSIALYISFAMICIAIMAI